MRTIKTNINFMKMGRYIFPISIVVMLISFGLVFLMEMNLGIDFTSGTRFDITLFNNGQKIQTKQIEDAIIQTSLKDNFTIKELGNEEISDAQTFSIISQQSFDEDEIHTKIPDWDRYSISKNGRIRDDKKCKFLEPYLSTKGYLSVTLMGKKEKGNFYHLSHLLGLAFIPNPDNLPEVHHKSSRTLPECYQNSYRNSYRNSHRNFLGEFP